MTRTWRVGELAQRTGLTVRTLHHYDELKLVVPSARTRAGHRLYDEHDVQRLYEVVALRRLGLPLAEVAGLLSRNGDPRPVVRRHLDDVEAKVGALTALRSRLQSLLDALDGGDAPSTEDLFDVLEKTTMIDRYYTPEQLAQLEQRRRQLGDDNIRQAEQEWAELIAAVEAERLAGTDPADPKLQALAGRWKELIEAFTGGDPGIRASLQRMYEEEGVEKASRGAVTSETSAYVDRILAANG